MKCPNCGGDLKTIDSRRWKQNKIRRRKECIICKHRVTTVEEIESSIERMKWEAKKNGWNSVRTASTKV